jgi:hypothetical protein
VDREKEDGNIRRVPFDLSSGIKAGEHRQTDIKKNQIRPPLQCFLDRFFSVCCLRALLNVGARLKNPDNTPPYDFVIVRDQNSHRVPYDADPGWAGTLVMGV